MKQTLFSFFCVLSVFSQGVILRSASAEEISTKLSEKTEKKLSRFSIFANLGGGFVNSSVQTQLYAKGRPISDSTLLQANQGLGLVQVGASVALFPGYEKFANGLFHLQLGGGYLGQQEVGVFQIAAGLEGILFFGNPRIFGVSFGKISVGYGYFTNPRYVGIDQETTVYRTDTNGQRYPFMVFFPGTYPFMPLGESVHHLFTLSTGPSFSLFLDRFVKTKEWSVMVEPQIVYYSNFNDLTHIGFTTSLGIRHWF